MRYSNYSIVVFPAVLVQLMLCLDLAALSAQDKSKLETALNYAPKQRDVDYDVPEKDQRESCRLDKSNEKFEHPGFVVYDPSGRVLRLFYDVNGDNKLDTWCYFKDGIEVYRDVDTDFNERADEFHWLGSAGMRRGKDTDNNYSIDVWEFLSASELAEEVFQCVRTADAARFKKLLVDSDQLKSLGLGEQNAKTTANKLREASAKFESFVKSQKDIDSRSEWTQFGGTRPGLVPKGLDGNKKDLVIFDHASAVFENAGKKFGQLSLGTIVEVSPNNWRLLELPQLVGEGQVVGNGGLFYSNSVSGDMPPQIADSNARPEAAEMVKLFEQYDALEKQAKETTGEAKIAELEQQRAELLMKLAQTSTEKEDKQNWIRQMADTVTSAYQTNRFPKGIEFLERQISKIEADGLKDQVPYIEWRIIFARFSLGHDGDQRDRSKSNERYIADLEKFADEYPTSSFAADALFQLGLNSEVTDRDEMDKAIEWYTRCRKQFPNTLFGKKSAGALLRLTSQGKPLPLSGTTLNGQEVNLQSSQFRDKIIIVHYWETWCDTGFEELQRLSAKYKDKIEIVGVNLDEDAAVVKKFLSQNRSANWPQLHSPGGVDKSPLAIQLGVATLPLTLLLDQRGNLVESNFPVDDLDREIQRLLRRETGQANRSGTTR